MTFAEKENPSEPRSLRFLLILEEVARLGVPATPTEINRTLGLPKQTLHRMFATLESEGFLHRDIDGRSYSPGPRLRKISMGTVSSVRVRAARLTIMSAISEDIGETVNLVIPDRHDMVYLDRVETNWPLRIQLPVGTHVPFHCTASGKLYLSSLQPSRLDPILNSGKFEKLTNKTITTKRKLAAEVDRVREAGFSQDNEEFIHGMVAVATPIKDANDRMVASLAFHAPTPRMKIAEALKHLDKLRIAAKKLSKTIRADLPDRAA